MIFPDATLKQEAYAKYIHLSSRCLTTDPGLISSHTKFDSDNATLICPRSYNYNTSMSSAGSTNGNCPPSMAATRSSSAW